MDILYIRSNGQLQDENWLLVVGSFFLFFYGMDIRPSRLRDELAVMDLPSPTWLYYTDDALA
jgi:hypothetical protein